ncbi:hypothetical protein [Sphingopyxis flava]|uniref:Uncharacterized protein n=1 Tax=Sphingopyxis flava TaxID=1507287 RepID=A0A1T4ZVQ4_9SPHN|nr:hypothetical protein [Sphingopyxis flava]SKB26874.1 hypothetical protein SAMN06295937_1001248 [Sphingopyxis flava]
MTGGTRTLAACLASVEDELREQPTHLAELVGEEIAAIEACAHGWRLRVGSGRAIVIQRGCTFDAAGKPVVEP